LAGAWFFLHLLAEQARVELPPGQGLRRHPGYDPGMLHHDLQLRCCHLPVRGELEPALSVCGSGGHIPVVPGTMQINGIDLPLPTPRGQA
jgi:hypothetical protein